jgi:AcrR family transcriptional regulator
MAPLQYASECDESRPFSIRFLECIHEDAKMQITPRKSPRQARAKVTVDAIVEATTQVLLSEGYENFTTARVAERAGVSIGSLYQYFPNKAALVSAVIDRCCDNFLGAFESAVIHEATLVDCIGAMVDFTFVSHHIEPELHRVVNELAPLIGVAERTQIVSLATAKAIESMLRKHAAEIAPEIDLAVAATILQTMLEALAHRLLTGMEHDDMSHTQTDRRKREVLAIEVTRLITRYLAIGS